MIDIYGREIICTEIDDVKIYRVPGIELSFPHDVDDYAVKSVFDAMQPGDWVVRQEGNI